MQQWGLTSRLRCAFTLLLDECVYLASRRNGVGCELHSNALLIDSSGITFDQLFMNN